MARARDLEISTATFEVHVEATINVLLIIERMDEDDGTPSGRKGSKALTSVF